MLRSTISPNVAGDDDGLAAVAANLRGDRLDRRDVAADEREAASLTREGNGDRRPHAFRRSRDHRHAPFQVQIHRLAPGSSRASLKTAPSADRPEAAGTHA